MAGRGGWLDPDVEKYVLDEAGERLVLEGRKHWVASFWLGLAGGASERWSSFSRLGVRRTSSSGSCSSSGWRDGSRPGWRMLEEYRDPFVHHQPAGVPGERVFEHRPASVPSAGFLDITGEEAD
jgi:hypothetical protein